MKIYKVVSGMLIALILVFTFSCNVSAHDEYSSIYSHPALYKLGRGVSNTITGWMEIPLQVRHYRSDDDVAASAATGVIAGFIHGTVRTLVGVYEFATFPLPFPENYAPLLPPLEYFNKTNH